MDTFSTFQALSSFDINTFEKDTLLVFVDETGQEELKDDKYPIFGYGGCAVLQSDYERLVSQPWRALKEKSFANENYPFHASSIRRPSRRFQSEAKAFFETQLFSRFGAMFKKSTSIAPEFTPYTATHYSTIIAIRNIAKWFHTNSSITLIMESSHRLNKEVEKQFGQVSFQIEGKEIPFYRYFLDKSTSESGLEIADFIVRASGRHALSQMNGKNRREEIDYIFTNVDKKYQYYIALDSVDFKPLE